MSLIVQKFGGTSVRDAKRIRNVAGIIAETYLAGNDVIVVLSAQGDTTDDLIAKAEEINPHASKREMDMLLSTGEQISVALCAMALEAMGLPCISLAAWQVGIQSTSVHSDARIKKIDTERIQSELDQHRIVIVTGFQGVDRNGDVTTLGRGGSDTSAVALAAAFRADLCQIYTDVDGVYTTDPRIVPSARKLDEITYDEMLELASQGAQVLHNRSVELAKKFRVNLEVVSSLERKPGTKVKEVTKVEKTNIAGVAKDTSIARVALIGLQHNPGVAFQVFDLLSKHNINVDVILQSIGREDTKDITFTVHKKDLEESKQILEEHKETLRFDHIETDESIGKVSIVGAGLMSNCGVAARMFEALYEAGINIQMINTSEIRVSVLLDEEDVSISPAGRAHRRALCCFPVCSAAALHTVERGEAKHERSLQSFCPAVSGGCGVRPGTAAAPQHGTKRTACRVRAPVSQPLGVEQAGLLAAACRLGADRPAGQGAPHAAAGSAGSGADAPGYDSGVLGLGGRRGKRRGEPGGLGGAAGGGHGLLPGRKKAPGAVGSPGSASGGAVHAADLHASGLGTIRQSAGMREDLLSRPSVVQYGRCIQENAASPGLPAGGHEEELRYERHRHRRGAG